MAKNPKDIHSKCQDKTEKEEIPMGFGSEYEITWLLEAVGGGGQG